MTHTMTRWGLVLLLLAPFAMAQTNADEAPVKAAKAAAVKAIGAFDAEADAAKQKELAPAKESALDALVEAVDKYADAGGDAETVKQYRMWLGENGRPQADLGAALGLAEKWISKGKDWAIEEGPDIALKAVIFLVILFVFRLFSRTASKVADKGLRASKLQVSDLLRNFFVNVTRKVIMVIGLIIALDYVGIPMGPLLAGIGVLGFVVGFALQDTLGNFASGIMILLYRPYDIGDVIDAGGTKGKVDAMSLVSTTLVTPDNQVVIIPNNSVWGATITNVTARDTRRVDLTFGCGYGDDLDKCEKMINDVVKAHPKVLADPAPTIKIANLGDSSVDFVVRPWAKTSDYWDVFFDLTKQLKQTADKEGIEIPFPQRDVHIYEEKVNR